MKQLKRALPSALGEDRHSHIIYLNGEAGVGFTSFENGHQHEVYYNPPIPEQQDPNTGELIPGSPGGWIIVPSELDGHSHEMGPLLIKGKKKKGDESRIVAEVHSLYCAWKDQEKDSIDDGKESYQFYKGKQWKEQDELILEKQGRACLTINITQKRINELVGRQINQRTDIRYLPTEGGDQKACDIFNQVAHHILRRTKYQREKSKVFRDQVVPGRGIFNLFVEFDQDLRGQIKIESFPWDQVVLAPHSKEDLSDCDGLIKFKWYSAAKIQQLWPKKAEEISAATSISGIDVTEFKSDIQHSHDVYSTPGDSATVLSNGDSLVNIATKDILVLECWRKEYKRVPVIANVEDDFYLNAGGWNQKDLKSITSVPGFTVVERPVTQMRITKIAGNVLLSDENPADLPAQDFFIVPAYGFRSGNDFWGAVKLAKDPQREINKRASQSVDIGNKMAGSFGWFYDDITFPDNEEENFKRNASKPGFTQKVTDQSRIPVKVEGTSFPAGIVELQAQSTRTLEDLISTVPEPGGANESGSLRLQKEKEKLIAIQQIFSNLQEAEQKVGSLLLRLIQKYWPAERVLRLIRNSSANATIAGQAVDEWSDEEIQTILDTADFADYDVEVSEASTSPSMRMMIFNILGEMAQAGVAIPPEMIVRYADMPEGEKQEVLNTLQQQSEAEAQTAQSAQDAEIEKTLVAKGIIPPAVNQRMQLDQATTLGDEGPISPPAYPEGIADGMGVPA